MDDRNAPLSFCRSGMTLVSILERGATEDDGNGAGAIRADDDFADVRVLFFVLLLLLL